MQLPLKPKTCFAKYAAAETRTKKLACRHQLRKKPKSKPAINLTKLKATRRSEIENWPMKPNLPQRLEKPKPEHTENQNAKMSRWIKRKNGKRIFHQQTKFAMKTETANQPEKVKRQAVKWR